MDILIFVVALSILVLVHEFGHFFAAKITGVKVEEFGLGLPPKIIGKRWKGTEWTLNWLPIGGFCRLYGEDPSSNEAAESKKGSFTNKHPLQKMLVVLGGVMMNLVLAIVIFTMVYAIMGIPKETDKVKIIGIAKNSPAETAGIKEGDQVLKVNGVVSVKKPQELTDEIDKLKGKEVELRVVGADGTERVVKIKPRENPPAGEGSMGVVISNTEMQKLKWYELYKGVGAGFKEAYFWGKIIFDGLTQMIGGLIQGQVPKDVSGPIGIFQATSSIKKSQGMLAVIHFFGIVSVNLAVVNILPFPALDGGRIIFVLYELLSRKRANEKFEAAVNNLGMLILLSMILMITVGDILRLVLK